MENKFKIGPLQGIEVPKELGRAIMAIFVSMGAALQTDAEPEEKEMLDRARKLAATVYDENFMQKASQAEFCIFIGSLMSLLANNVADHFRDDKPMQKPGNSLPV